jgi:hypothetical protein
MAITDTISKVLKQRENNLPKLKKIEERLSDLHDQLSKLHGKAKQIPNESGVPQDFVHTVSAMGNQVNELQREVSSVKDSISELKKRFSKGTINIGVAGKPRQGKSTLLQKISGLKNDVIPAFKGDSCTGTKSRIYNSSEVYAKIDFYTKKEFFENIVQPLFKELELSSVPTSFEDFEKPLDNFTKGNARIFGNAKYTRLKFIQNALPSIKNLIEKGTITLKEISEILRYILIHDPDDQTKEFTDYLAVKVVNIYTDFPRKDVTGLGLIDLPGLEAIRGFEKQLITSLQSEVDAVIFVKRPDHLGSVIDTEDYKIFDSIEDTAGGIKLTNWLFIVLNELADGLNTSTCERTKEQLVKESPELRDSNIIIANASDPEEVEEKIFSVVLSHLEKNLANNDEQLVKTPASKMESVYDSLRKSIQKVEDFLERFQGEDERHKFSKLLFNRRDKNSFLNQLSIKLESLLDRLRPSGQKGIDSSNSTFKFRLQQKVGDICKSVNKDSPIPDTPNEREQYEERLIEESRGFGESRGGWNTTVETELNRLRVQMAKGIARELNSFLEKEIDDTLRKMLSEAFPQSLEKLLSPGMSFNNPRSAIKELRDILARDMEKNTEEEKEKLSNLYEAFKDVAGFDFTYFNHFHHRVRSKMDGLSTYSTATNEIIPDNTSISKETASTITQGLQNAYRATLYEVKKRLSQINENPDEDPSYLIFTLIENFKDQLVRAENAEEAWEAFLYPYRHQIWEEAYQEQKRILALHNEWKNIINETLKSVEQAQASTRVFHSV